MMKILYCCFLLLLSISSLAQDISSIQVKLNAKHFSITLDANPTTGYQWSIVQYDKKLFTLSKSEFQKPQTQLIGAGGKMVFNFSINPVKSYPASSDILFKYARPWESKSGRIKKIRVNLM